MSELTTRAVASEQASAPTRADLVGRATALVERIREAQDESEARGHYGPEIHEAFLAAGFYHLLAPRRYGGIEADLADYLAVIIEVSRGDPSTGWCLVIGCGHCLTTASHWPESAQDRVFRTEAGYYRASHSVAGTGTARRVDGGYVVDARSPYQSSVPYATHATVNVLVEGEDLPRCAIVERSQFDVLDDWGGDRALGQRASGSNTVVVTGALVPEDQVVPFDWAEHDYVAPSVGNTLHGNAMYLGPVAGFFQLELAATVVGAAKAAVEEYERIITSRTTLAPPFVLRSEDPDHLGDLGMGMTMADAAEALVLAGADRYTAACTALVERGEPFTMELDCRIFGIAQRAAEMASEAVALLFRSAGSSAGMRGQRMQRYFRDASMYRGHVSAQYRWTARRLAEIHFGRRKSPF